MYLGISLTVQRNTHAQTQAITEEGILFFNGSRSLNPYATSQRSRRGFMNIWIITVLIAGCWKRPRRFYTLSTLKSHQTSTEKTIRFRVLQLTSGFWYKYLCSSSKNFARSAHSFRSSKGGKSYIWRQCFSTNVFMSAKKLWTRAFTYYHSSPNSTYQSWTLWVHWASF